ncbi:MAG: diguanylate cyclase [Nitrospirota bacterium]
MVKVAIIGAGKGGANLIELFHREPDIKIIAVADNNRNAEGMKIARRLKIPTSADYKRLIKSKKIDFIIDVTGDKNVEELLKKDNRIWRKTIGGKTAKFMWQITYSHINAMKEIEQLLYEYKSLYDLGVKLASYDNLEKIFSTIIDYATELTNTPAGSIGLFDEKKGEMSLVNIKGFSRKFTKQIRWKIRMKGLTSNVLNQKEPLVVPDVRKYSGFDNPVMKRERIKSLMAAPLIGEGKILGILYVDDFHVRKYTQREISALSLLSTIAAMTIEKMKLLESTRFLATTDELTGLYNHRHFLEQLTVEVSRAVRYKHHVTLMMLDIDYFKEYNDTHGHLKGNDILEGIGSILKDVSREVDIVARYGGEEFSIILTETSKKKGSFLAERIRKRIEGFPFEGREKQPGKKLTVSIGIATYPDNASSPFELIEQADIALYKAKRSGKNKVCSSAHKAQ